MKIRGFSLVMAVSMLLGASSAEAGLADLGRVLAGPVGRFFLVETTEGAELVARLVGRRATAATDRQVSDLVARLGRAENRELAAQLEARLKVSRERLQIELTSGAVDDAAALLRRILSESLAIDTTAAAAGRIEFAPVVLPQDYANVVKAFKAADGAKSLAGGDFAAKAFDSGAALGPIDFRFAMLRRLRAPFAQLEGAKLSYADLSEAELVGIEARGADLAGARARGAKLRDAILRGANLQGADLRGAHLVGADLSGADLRGADLSDAFVGGTFFRAGKVEADFSGAIINERTNLPFSREVARRLGVVTAQ